MYEVVSEQMRTYASSFKQACALFGFGGSDVEEKLHERQMTFLARVEESTLHVRPQLVSVHQNGRNC